MSDQYIRSYALNPPFPQVQKTSKTATLPATNDDFSFADKPIPPKNRAFSLPIRNSHGKVLYIFECSSTEPIMRWGVSCGLFAVGQIVNLLRDSIDAYSRLDRATFFPEQLIDVCSNYPDWGAEREFRLRGLRLTVRVTEVKFVPSEWDWYGKGISHVTLTAEAEPDIKARSPIAELPKHAYWGYTFRDNPSDACSKPFDNPLYHRDP